MYSSRSRTVAVSMLRSYPQRPRCGQRLSGRQPLRHGSGDRFGNGADDAAFFGWDLDLELQPADADVVPRDQDRLPNTGAINVHAVQAAQVNQLPRTGREEKPAVPTADV